MSGFPARTPGGPGTDGLVQAGRRAVVNKARPAQSRRQALRADAKASNPWLAQTRQVSTQEWLHEKTGDAIYAFRTNEFARAVEITDRLLAQNQGSELLRALRREALSEARKAGIGLPHGPAGQESPEPEPAKRPHVAQEWQHQKTGEAIYAFRTSDFGKAVEIVDQLLVQSRGNGLLRAIRREALAEAHNAGIELARVGPDGEGVATEAPQSHVGTREWLHDRTGDAIHAFRSNDFERAVDIVEQALARTQGDVLLLEVGGFSGNRAASWPAAARFWAALSHLQGHRRGPRVQHAAALMECGEGNAALEIIDPLLAGDPHSVELIRLKIAILARHKDFGVLQRFDVELSARAWTSADARLLEAIGAAFVSANHPAMAHRWLERTRKLDPHNTGALFLQARLAYAERQYDLAATQCQELERCGTPVQQFEARMILGRIASLRGNPKEATRRYEKVVADQPANIEAVTYLVRRVLAERDVAKAERYMAAVPRQGNEGTHDWWRALVLQAARQGEQAVEHLLKALKASPASMTLRHRTIEFMLETDRLGEALAAIHGGLELEPTSARLRARLLQVHLRMDSAPQQIVDICTETLAVAPRDEDALLQRGNAYTRLGNRRLAIADFKSGIDAFPRNITFWRSIITSLIFLGEDGEVRLLLERARAIFASSTADDVSALAEIFSAADRHDEALGFAEAAVKADPASASRQLVARIQVRRGHFDLAWPHLLRLQDDEQRRMRTTRLFAKVAAGRSTALPWVGEGAADRSFPQSVFDAIVRRPPAVQRESGRLRVLHVTSSLGAGGAERQLTNTVLRLAELSGTGVEVELAVEDLSSAHGRDFFLAPVQNAGLAIHCLKDERQAANWRDMLARRPDLRGAVQAIGSMPDEVVRIALPLLPILIERQPDVVQLWQDTICIAGGLTAVLAGVPRILLCTRSTHPVERQRARPYLEGGYRALLRQPGVSLFNNSEHGARDYERWLKLSANSVNVVRNGYDFEAIRSRIDDGRSRQIHRELGIPPSAPVLGGVMRCSFEKRPELWTATAIELCQKMPEARAILVGDGPMMGQIKGRVAECGLADRIHYVGRQSPVEPWMRAMDLLFLSSLTEGLPNVLIEAQSLGVPVATMRIGGAPETVIENETAIVLDEGPVAGIADPIGALLGDRMRRKAFGRRAAQWTTDQFGIEATVDKLLGYYRASAGAA